MLILESLPQFPLFRLLQISDFDIFSSHSANLPPYSDTNFVSLFSWDIKQSCKISNLNNNLIILFQDYLSQKFCLTIAGDSLPNETIAAMNNFIKKIPYNGGLKYIPKYIAETIDPKRWQVIESAGTHDYILAIDKLKHMDKWHHSSIPNSIRRFEKSTPEFTFTVTKNGEVDWGPYLAVFEYWLNDNELDIWANNEYKAFKRFTKLKFDTLLTFSIFIDGALKAFDCCELINEKYVVAHFSKADKSFKGIYEALQLYTAIFLDKEKFEYINIEQDLGLEGLRFSKSKYEPIVFLEKFIIKPSSI